MFFIDFDHRGDWYIIDENDEGAWYAFLAKQKESAKLTVPKKFIRPKDSQDHTKIKFPTYESRE